MAETEVSPAAQLKAVRHRQDMMMGRESDSENKRLDSIELTKAICAADRALIAAESSRDLELAMTYMAPNVILQPPDMPMVVGYEAAREYYSVWFAVPYTSIQVRAQTVNVASSGDIAYIVGESSFVLSNSQGEQQVPGKYLGVWKKIDGNWKLAAISWSGDAASGKG